MMKINKFIPTVLTLAITTALAGCGGGSSSHNNNVMQIPTDTNNNQNNNANSNNNQEDTSNYPNMNNELNIPEYNINDFTVTEPDTSTNKVKIGVIDTGIRNEGAIKQAVTKVLSYAKSDDNTLTVTDITDANVALQDLNSSNHGTLVANVLAAKKTTDPKYENIRDGLAKDIAELYGVQTSIKNGGLGTTDITFMAMADLNKTYGVRLFNASFGTHTVNDAYRNKLIEYATPLIENDSLIVFSTGNNGSLTPNAEALLPMFNSNLEQGWLAVTGTDSTKTALYKDIDSNNSSNACGNAAQWCLAADYLVGKIYSEKNQTDIYFAGTSASAPQITALAAMVWSKYPWMTADQVRQTILTTATYIDDGTNNHLFNTTFGWGYFNEVDALNGPHLFSTIFAPNFTANITDGISIFSNNISGDAGLEKKGNGTLVLTGKNTYEGITNLYEGNLRVNGSISNQVNVADTGILSGTGSVGSTNNNGTVSTENGRLTINGDYVQQSNATLAYGLNHYLTVNGIASLAGSLTVSAQNKQMVTEGSHTVIKANSINGHFKTVTAKSAFLEVGDTSSVNNEYIVDVKFKDASTTGTVNGGISTASGQLTNLILAKANLQSTNSEATELTDYVAKIQQVTTPEQAQAILNTNSGAIFAETPSVLLHNDTLTNAQVTQRTYQVTQHNISGLWSSGSYLETSTKADDWDKVKSHISIFTVGADTIASENLMLGSYISSYHDKSKFSESLGDSETDLITLGIYSKWNLKSDFYLSTIAKYGTGKVKFDRRVTNGIDSELSHAISDLHKYGIYGELGYNHFINQLSIFPYISLSFNSVKLDDINESSKIGVSINQIATKETKTHMGMHFDYQLTKLIKIGGYGEYAYAFDRSLPNVKLHSNLDKTINVNYTAPSFDKDYFLYGLTFNYVASKSNWNLFANLSANTNNSDDIQTLIGLKYAF